MELTALRWSPHVSMEGTTFEWSPGSYVCKDSFDFIMLSKHIRSKKKTEKKNQSFSKDINVTQYRNFQLRITK